MKLPIYAMAALACAGMAASCSSDEPLAGGQNGAVTFTVNLPGQIASRAFGKGQDADSLKCLVYEVNGNTTKFVMPVDGDGTFSSDAKPTTTVTLQLAKGTAYKVIFWGYNPSQTDFDPQTAVSKAYNWTTSTGNLSVNYAAMTDWSENYDAFIKVVDVPATGATDTNVELTRPFAQLNIGTDDLTAGTVESKYGNPAQVYTTVGVKGLLNAWNPLDNTTTSVGDVYTNFGPADQPDATGTTAETFPVTGYSYLAMNYLLVGTPTSPQVTHDVQLTFGNAATPAGVSGTNTITSVPFQTNFQTNIFGSLLTNSSKYTVTINPAFDGNKDVPQIPVGTVLCNGAQYSSLQDAFDSVDPNATTPQLLTIQLGAGEFTFPTSHTNNKTLVIKGVGPTTVINATARNAAATYEYSYELNNCGGITFENLTLNMGYGNYRGFNTRGNGVLTIKDCTVTGNQIIWTNSAVITGSTITFTSGEAFWLGAARNVEFSNCSFDAQGGNAAINVYNDGIRHSSVVNVDNCSFTRTGDLTGKVGTAIEINSTNLAGTSDTYTVNINGCTVSGDYKADADKEWWANGLVGLSAWTIKPNDTKPTGNVNLTVTVDGNKLWPNN